MALLFPDSRQVPPVVGRQAPQCDDQGKAQDHGRPLPQRQGEHQQDASRNGGYSIAQAQAVGVLMRDLGRLARATYGVNGTLSDEGKVWNRCNTTMTALCASSRKTCSPAESFCRSYTTNCRWGVHCL